MTRPIQVLAISYGTKRQVAAVPSLAAFVRLLGVGWSVSMVKSYVDETGNHTEVSLALPGVLLRQPNDPSQGERGVWTRDDSGERIRRPFDLAAH